MSLKAHGVQTFASLIEQNVSQAQYLEKLLRARAGFELLAPVALNTVCFRYHPSNWPEQTLNSLNQEILYRVQESGIAVISSTILDGRFVLRAAITNHRSRREDFDAFVDALSRIAAEVSAVVMQPSSPK